jgi:HlyD family secretion protein
MDAVVRPKSGRKRLLFAAAAVSVVLCGVGLWRMVPRGLQVPAADVRVATVERAVFSDDVVVRAKAEAFKSVILDSVESGRVEEVFARDGAMVKEGAVLFRISNSQRHLELLQRQTEHTQQISNLANLRVNFEVGNTEHERRLADLRFNLEQARKRHARNQQLAAKGFISPEALETSTDNLAQQEHLAEEERVQNAAETGVKRAAVRQMERAIQNIEIGLKLVSASVDALLVRAPVAGRLTDFKLQVGEAVRQDQHIGRIDDPRRFKLVAQADEYYLGRVAPGRPGQVRLDGKVYPLTVDHIYPQITDGRFSVELLFPGAQPDTLSPGQGMDVQITLGAPGQALLLPNGPFLADSGGAWAFVVASNGRDVEKREIKIGRRNSRQVEVLAGLAPGEKVVVSSYAEFGNATRLQLNK